MSGEREEAGFPLAARRSALSAAVRNLFASPPLSTSPGAGRGGYSPRRNVRYCRPAARPASTASGRWGRANGDGGWRAFEKR